MWQRYRNSPVRLVRPSADFQSAAASPSPLFSTVFAGATSWPARLCEPRDTPIPIQITKPSEVVPKLLPLMQVGMRAMSLYNGAEGIARMFGAPLPSVPTEWRKGAQDSIELLKQQRSVEAFGVVTSGSERSGVSKGSGHKVQSAFEKPAWKPW